MMNLYLDDTQILFGRKGFVKKDSEMSRMVKRLDNV